MRIKLDEKDVEVILKALKRAEKEDIGKCWKYYAVEGKIVAARNYSVSNKEPRGFLACKSDQG